MAQESAETCSNNEQLGVIDSIVSDDQLIEVIVQEASQDLDDAVAGNKAFVQEASQDVDDAVAGNKAFVQEASQDVDDAVAGNKEASQDVDDAVAGNKTFVQEASQDVDDAVAGNKAFENDSTGVNKDTHEVEDSAEVNTDTHEMEMGEPQGQDGDAKEDAQQLVFKCIPMSSDGKPDTAKTLKLNRDILKEVLEKHGFSMDPGEWPEYALEVDDHDDSEEKLRKQKKKAKKMKRKKDRQDKAKEMQEQMKCKFCKRQFYDTGHLKVHEKVHLDENEEPLECSICNMMFKREIGLKYHMLKTHNKGDDKGKTDKEDEVEGTFSCEEDGCAKSFKTNKGLRLHVNQIHKGIGKIKSLKSFKDEIGDLQCEKCDKIFHKPSKLSMHMLTHSDLNLKCTECGTVCKSHNLLRRHYAQVHQDVKPCSQCGKRLKIARIVTHNLDPEAVPDAVKAQSDKICYKCYAKANRARKRKHDGDELTEDDEEKEEFLKCPVCSLIYYGIRGLRNHMKRTHPEEPQETDKDDDYDVSGDYPCVEDNCIRVFTTKRGLGLHMVAQHIRDARYPCTKEGCDRVFITRSGLSSHIKRHEMPVVYECDMCEKKYDANYKLTEHKKSHKDPLLECEQCDKKFRRQGMLCQHIREHTGTVFLVQIVVNSLRELNMFVDTSCKSMMVIQQGRLED
ncbi:uncharacterized protein [Amphiura filiformis]|uniref:uncharacterized protein n=1 Tax=Amphiura filiformis TaxID=82378 RepID=UPI003B211EDA